MQELVEIVGRSTGIALMAPPTDSATAQKTLDTLLSAVNKKQKVACAFLASAYCCCICITSLSSVVRWQNLMTRPAHGLQKLLNLERRGTRRPLLSLTDICSPILHLLNSWRWSCAQEAASQGSVTICLCRAMLPSQVLIAESYGGRDEPVDTLTNNFVGVGVEPALEPIRVKEIPNEATYQVHTCTLSLCTS